MTEKPEQDTLTRVETGVEGLDDVLCGGYVRNRVHLIEGDPGSGKTTLAMQFLLAGVARGERCLFVALSESEDELRSAAASHGWTLDGIDVLEIIRSEENLAPDARYTMFHPSEVELGQTVKSVLDESLRLKPRRLVFDSLAELRLLAENPLRYRRQIVILKQHFARAGCTALFVNDRTGEQSDMHLFSLLHSIISLDNRTAEYGTLRRRLQVIKVRGCAFRDGYHDFVIRRGGLRVFQRLVAAEQPTLYARESLKSGLEGLDALLGGGLARGTSTLVVGPAGSGKSSIATQYAHASATRGEHTAVFLFDESVATFAERSAGLGLDITPLVNAGTLSVRRVDSAELSPGEFSCTVCEAVEKDHACLVVIDSLSGYLNSMPSERFVALHLHELLTYLGQRGVTTIVLMAQHGLFGTDTHMSVDATYLVDTVVLLRYFEALGEVRQAISVIKKRTGEHERTIRELHLDGMVSVGEPVREFQGVLTGSPVFVGDARSKPN